VTIRGEDYNFLVSTGHHIGLIDKKLAQKLGYKIFRKDDMDLCIVPKLNIGKLDYTTTIMEVFDFNNADCGCTKIDGYIGTNMMSLSLWQLDYPNEKIIIASHSDSLQYAVNKQVVHFHTWHKNCGAPIVNLSVNQNYYCDIAVASVGCFSIELPNSAFNPLTDSLPRMIENSLFFEKNKQKVWTSNIAKVKGLTIGENVPIDKFEVFQSSNNDSYIGNEILHHFAVTFDWKRKQIIFASPQPVYNKEYGFTFCTKDNARIITSLTKDSPAEKMGLQLGDKVIKINDLDISQFTPEQMNDLGKESNKKYWSNRKKGLFPSANITVQRGTEIKIFDIEAVEDDVLFLKRKK
jgi:hypothetical protein